MIVIPLDDLAWEPKPGTVKSAYREAIGVRIDNEDGSKMYAVETVAIEIEEDLVTKQQQPHLKVPLTFKSAMWMGLGFIAVALGGAWTMYTHLDNKLESYRSGTESKIETARASLDGKISDLGKETKQQFESARLESKADNKDMAVQLQAISSSLSEINGKLSKDK